MKIAIVCDWLVAVGGAEKVLNELLTCYPQADLFSLIDFVDKDKRGFLQNKPVKTSFIQYLPMAKKRYPIYLPLMPLAIEQLDLSAYDLILSSSHAVAKGVLTGANQLHVSYVHSPMRYAWDLQHQYLRETGLHKKWRGLVARYLLHRLRLWDVRTANGVDHFIANSHFIARRVQKTYRREAQVIYPPVDLSRFTPHHPKEDFYLAASRLVPYKRMDLIVEAFKDMPSKKLIVIGDGPELTKIKQKSPSNVEVLGYQGNDTLLNYLQRAKALIFAAEEDFGLIPLEAQACGTPVIAYGKGGALETVRGMNHEKPSGLFFAEQTTRAICEAVAQFEQNETLFTVENCTANAARFSPKRFRQQLMQTVQEKWDAFQGR